MSRSIRKYLLSDLAERVSKLEPLLVRLEERAAKLEQMMAREAEEAAAFRGEFKSRIGTVVLGDPEIQNMPETALARHLLPCLCAPVAVDVGANAGEISERLLAHGLEVYAFEPNPVVFQAMMSRLGKLPKFHGFQYALGPQDSLMTLHLASDHSGGKYEDPSLYSTLKPHPLVEGLVFDQTVEVPVKTLGGLQRAGVLPTEIGILKIDTEGYDLEVIRGMGEARCSTVMAEFWDEAFVFNQGSTLNRLSDLVAEMKSRAYPFSLAICRLDGATGKLSLVCNSTQAPRNSWGNVFFFADARLFQRAFQWCSAFLQETVAL